MLEILGLVFIVVIAIAALFYGVGLFAMSMMATVGRATGFIIGILLAIIGLALLLSSIGYIGHLFYSHFN